MTQIQKLREKYNHPYVPYEIQLDFMDAVTDVLNKNLKIGIFESPTGTGKTLSLVCSTITWLREHKELRGSSPKIEDSSDSEPDWINASYANLVQNKELHSIEAYEKKLDDLAQKKKHRKISELKNKEAFFKRKKIQVEINEENDDIYLPTDYVSDTEEEMKPLKLNQQEKNEQIGSDIQLLLKKIDNRDKDYSSILDQKTQIIFASRTHSQLNQFSSQLRLPQFPSSYKGINQHLKYLPLGSRKQLCIHEKISKINDTNLMNEACLDLQKSDNERSCPYYPKQNNLELQDRTNEFRDYVFSEIHDIESLPSLGQEIGICPYYSVRKGVSSSEVMTVPYQLLLHKTSRDTLGISLKGSIIIIDEAHNLLDTITSIHSITVSVEEFNLCKESLKKYLLKFSRRMNGGNRVHLMKLVKTIDLILKYVKKFEKISPGKAIDLMEMFEGTTGDLLNVHKLEKYLTVSKIAFKIESYMDKELKDKLDNKTSNTPILFKVVDFLKAISNPSKEGSFFFDVKSSKTFLSYMLLDPSQVFKEIVEESKCVILAGGTMEPTEDFTEFLFPYVDKNMVEKFSCGHVIPKENLEVFIVGKNHFNFEFSFNKRDDTNMIDDLGDSVLQLSKKIDGGIVLFVPSYKYLSQIIDCWKKSSNWESINSIKRIFTESSTKDVLSDYSEHIAAKKGGLLLSVIGGSLSEGINFSDDLARSVMIVGLPYPNAFSGDMILKKKYIESEVLKKTKDQRLANEATRQFYENICMRAVNQSVGRSIRHINDYSTIYLFDSRYNSNRIQNKLSKWIKERISNSTEFSSTLNSTEEFFKNKKKMM